MKTDNVETAEVAEAESRSYSAPAFGEGLGYSRDSLP